MLGVFVFGVPVATWRCLLGVLSMRISVLLNVCTSACPLACLFGCLCVRVFVSEGVGVGAGCRQPAAQDRAPSHSKAPKSRLHRELARDWGRWQWRVRGRRGGWFVTALLSSDPLSFASLVSSGSRVVDIIDSMQAVALSSVERSGQGTELCRASVAGAVLCDSGSLRRQLRLPLWGHVLVSAHPSTCMKIGGTAVWKTAVDDEERRSKRAQDEKEEDEENK